VATKRLRKKISRRVLAESARGDRPVQPFAREVVHLELACPSCRRHTLTRTYVPRLGSMNWMVACSRCEYRDQFANALALVMSEADPVPAAFTVPKRELARERRAFVPRRTVLHELGVYAAAWMRALARGFRNATAPVPSRL
jgi:hypothetical protein